MSKSRVPIFLVILIVILSTTGILIQYGKGYRPNTNGTLTPTGLLVANSDPKGAQVFINGKLQTATDDTISLAPDTYQVEIRKDGFIPWKKAISVEKELVKQTNAILFPILPDLKALTYTGAVNPSLSPNGTRIIYIVPKTETEQTATSSATPTVAPDDEKVGLWMLELSDLPLGFNRDPQQIVTGEPNQYPWTDAEFIWSPDSREILAVFYPPVDSNTNLKNETITASQAAQLNTPQRVYRLSLSQSITSNQLVNITSNYKTIIQEWQGESQDKLDKQLSTLPTDFQTFLATAAADIRFSPDETKIMYTATDSAQLLEHYIPPVLATDDQPQTRQVEPQSLYTYDIKEDQNYLIDSVKSTKISSEDSQSQDTSLESLTSTLVNPQYKWFPTSRHLIKTDGSQITIIEYNNSNPSTIYSSPLPVSVFPHPSSSKLIILTTLNQIQAPTANLYTLILR